MKAIKQIIKRFLLRKKNIFLDRYSNINYNVKHQSGKRSRIVNSTVNITNMGEGCYVENACIYGDVEVGRFVNITGPGIIIHAEINKIAIGSFSSIAPNVSIIEFNHDMSRPTTSSIQSVIFGKTPRNDFISKGSIIIEEDVWVGSNVAILSGVKIGRGAIIAAGSVVNKDVEAYSVYGGVPARKLKMRFSEEEIYRIEELHWWNWDEETIRKNEKFFEGDIRFVK